MPCREKPPETFAPQSGPTRESAADRWGDTSAAVRRDADSCGPAESDRDSSALDDLRGLAAAARAGDQDAMFRLLEACREDLLRVVRRGLPRSMRRLTDSQDFLQAVWATFFINQIDPTQFNSSDQLLAYLRGIASHKVVDQIRRRLGTQKRCLDREVSISRLGRPEIGELVRNETPSQFAIARERMERLLDGQPEHYRQILQLRAEGASIADVAAAVDLNEGTVRRVLGRIAERMGDGSGNKKAPPDSQRS